jgi:hypothetical protein
VARQLARQCPQCSHRLVLDPASIQGEYAEIQELKEKAEAEKKAAQDKKDARNKASTDLVKLFYRASGIKPENRKTTFTYLHRDESLFSFQDYSGDVIIDAKGVIPLLTALQQLTANQKSADK